MIDVAVVGAGAAGLAAAADLVESGFEVVVLEARDRIGGRIFTRSPVGPRPPIELGAEFIHGAQHALLGLAARANAQVVEPPDTHLWQREGRFAPIAGFWDRIGRILQQLEPDAGDRSFREALARIPGLSDEDRALVLAFVEGYHAAPADDIDAASLAQPRGERDPNDTRQFELPAGYAGVLAPLARTVEGAVRLSVIVTEIAWRRGHVEVRVRDAGGEVLPPLEARSVLLTVPLGVLQRSAGDEGAIAFLPSIAPHKSDALARLGMARVTKVVLELKSAVWEEVPALRGEGLPRPGEVKFLHARETVPTWWTALPARAPRIVAWSGGPAAQELSRRGDDLVSAVLDSLARLLGIDRATLVDRLEASYTHDWHSDPYARGAYSYQRVGGGRARAQLAAPIDDTLFFAGEATCTRGRDGTVDGAIATGRRAGREIRNVLSQ